MIPDFERLVEQVVERITPSTSVLFITGAGVSADSGLPTYRGVGGLYEDSGTEDGMAIEQVLTSRMLEDRPELVWKYLAEVGRVVLEHEPNQAHEVIAQFEKNLDRCWVLTQNIDGYHRQAGTKNLIDIHGDMRLLRCSECGVQYPLEVISFENLPPTCFSCQGALRPDVVLFGDLLPQKKLARLISELETGFDLVFSIGTSSLFPYIAEPIRMAARQGGFSVEINPGESGVSELVDLRIQSGAALAMGAIWSAWSKL